MINAYIADQQDKFLLLQTEKEERPRQDKPHCCGLLIMD